MKIVSNSLSRSTSHFFKAVSPKNFRLWYRLTFSMQNAECMPGVGNPVSVSFHSPLSDLDGLCWDGKMRVPRWKIILFQWLCELG